MILIKSPENTSFSVNVNFTVVEHKFHYEMSLPNKVFGAFTIGAIILVNFPLLRYIFKHGNNTFINKLIAIDCCLCIGNIIPAINYMTQDESRFRTICLAFPPYGFFVNILNRLLSIAIVFYRYVFVLQSSWVRTQFQRRLFCFLVAGAITILSTSLSALCLTYREQYVHYLGINI